MEKKKRQGIKCSRLKRSRKKPVRTQWHEPIPQILAATQEAQVSAIQSMTEITAIRVVGEGAP
jgi:hypothetical protein